MKIIEATLYPNRGGSTRVMLAAAQALGREHAVHVRAPLPEADSQPPVTASLAPLSTPWRKLAALPRLAGAVAAEAAFLRRECPDIVHVHDMPGLIVYGLAGRLTGTPVLWHVHQVAGRGGWRDALAAARIDLWPDATEGPPGQRRAVIPNPVTILDLPPPARAGAPRLGVLGSLCRSKNQRVAIEALAILRSRGASTLSLFGDVLEPDEADALTALARERGVEGAVARPGFTPLAQALAATDVMLAPSLVENQPLSVLEALAAGRPVVASDIPAHRALADLLQTPALQIVPATAEAFAQAIDRAEPDPAIRAKVAEYFSQDVFSHALCEFVGLLKDHVGKGRRLQNSPAA